MPPGWQIAPDKRACIDGSGQFPGGRLLGNYPQTGSGRLPLQNPVTVVAALGLAIAGAFGRIPANEKLWIVLEWRVLEWPAGGRHRDGNGLRVRPRGRGGVLALWVVVGCPPADTSLLALER